MRRRAESTGMVNARLPNDGGSKAPRALSWHESSFGRATTSNASRRADCAFERNAAPRGIGFLTMKIVQILGKLAEDLSRTCAKSRAPNQPHLQSPLLACLQPR